MAAGYGGLADRTVVRHGEGQPLRDDGMHLSGRTQGAFVGYRGRERSSFFFRRGRTTEYIRKGCIFRRVHADRTVESARVLAMAIDGFGIPHV